MAGRTGRWVVTSQVSQANRCLAHSGEAGRYKSLREIRTKSLTKSRHLRAIKPIPQQNWLEEGQSTAWAEWKQE